MRVETPFASGDLLRVARKSDSLRFQWLYRIRRDRRPIVPLPRHAALSLARCFACLGMTTTAELLNRQIQGCSGPAGRHYLPAQAPLLLIDQNVTGESLYAVLSRRRRILRQVRSKFKLFARRLRCSNMRVLLIRFMHALQPKHA